MPAPVTDLEITAEDDSPLATLAWDHDGIDADRFQLLNRPDADSPWSSILIAPVGDFGAGPYTASVVTTTGSLWAVRVLSASGEVSV
jgi:hypothetical protein